MVLNGPHHATLVRDQELAKIIFDRVAHSGSLSDSSLRYLQSAYAMFNGDILLAARRPSGEMHLLLGDFTGHGLPAAIGAMPLAEIFYGMTAKGFGLSDILREMNLKLKSILPVGFFCCTAVVDLDVEALKAFPKLKSITLTDNPLSKDAILVQIPELEFSGIKVDLGTSVAARVKLSAEKTELPASLASTTDITVTVADASGNAVKRETVDLTVDKGTIQSPAANNGDGTYTATYAATDVSGDVTITALTSNGKFGSLKIKLVEIVVSKDKSTLEISGSNKAGTDETVSVVITLVSEDDLALSGRSVELKVNPDEKVIINPSTKTDKDGKITVVFASGKPGLKIVSASSGEVTLTASKAVIFTGDEIDLEPVAVAETVTAVATKTSLEADGESTSKLTITVLDADGDALTDQKLQLEVENGTLGEVVNNNDGTYAATYIAGTKGRKTLGQSAGPTP